MINAGIYLVIDETPLLQECMHPHYSTDISSKISSTSGHSEIFRGIQTVCVNHEVTVVFINGRSLASIAAIEEFGKGPFLGFVDSVHVKPSAVAWKNDGMSLCH